MREEPTSMKESARLFADALLQAESEFYVDAIDLFWRVVNSGSSGDLADDALCNIALCCFQLHQYPQAIATAKRLIEEYPNGIITELGTGGEIGFTAAKAYYILVQCYVRLGQLSEAKRACEALQGYRDSYIITNTGQSISYKQLAEGVLQQHDKS